MVELCFGPSSIGHANVTHTLRPQYHTVSLPRSESFLASRREHDQPALPCNHFEDMLNLRIWDLPTRLFHWMLVLLVVALIVTAKVGGNAMLWHMRCGYAVLALLLFRVVWGFAGGHWSRFSSFVFSPRQTWAYVRGHFAAPAGHSPLGALSVFALLGTLAAQVVSGLFADDEIAFSGPLGAWVSSDAVSRATWYHTEVGQPAVIALIVLHLLAIAYYALVRRQVLVRPMLTGNKVLEDPRTPASRDHWRSRLLALVILLASASLVAWLVQLTP